MKIPFILKENEEVLQVFGSYGLFLILPISLGIFLTLAPWFYFVRLYDFGPVGLGAFVLSQTIGLSIIIRKIYIWRMNLLVITNYRIVDINQKSIFNRVISEVGYDILQNITYEVKGVVATFLNYGNLIFETIGSDTAYVFRRVKNPARIQNLVIEAKSAANRFGVDKVSNILQTLPNLTDVEQQAILLSLGGMLKKKKKD